MSTDTRPAAATFTSSDIEVGIAQATPVNFERVGRPLRIAEIHTTDLTTACLRRVYLRHTGQWNPEVTSAMARGSLFDHAATYIHECDGWNADPCEISAMAVNHGIKQIHAEAKDTGRPLSEACARDLDGPISDTVLGWVRSYIQRFREYFTRCDLIGCQVPIRCTIAGQEFASHLDLMFRERWDGGVLRVWDWKCHEDAPSREYLARNIQLGTYWWAVAHGEVLLQDDILGGIWTKMEEHPVVSWVHIPNLEPYKRGGERKNGETFAKGDERPLDSVVMTVDHCDEGAVVDVLRERVAMMRVGFWPMNPDKVGCYLCECRAHCPRFDRTENGNG